MGKHKVTHIMANGHSFLNGMSWCGRDLRVDGMATVTAVCNFPFTNLCKTCAKAVEAARFIIMQPSALDLVAEAAKP